MKQAKKKWIFIGVGLFIALSILAITMAFVKKVELTPAASIMAFHKAAESGDIDTAKEYVTSEILEAFEKGAFPHYGTFGGFLSQHRQDVLEMKPLTETQHINGNIASIDVKVIHQGNRESTETYFFKKENGTWKISQ